MVHKSAPHTYPSAEPPIVLCAGGHDPTGGAGLVADVEAVRACGAHAATVITSVTTQSTCRVTHIAHQEPRQVAAQWQAIMADSPVVAIKIGLLGSTGIAAAICELLRERPEIPVILDPVLTSSSGASLVDNALVEELHRGLLGHCTLITPNEPEARALSGRETAEDCARTLLDAGCQSVLITGTHAPTVEVVNRLYERDLRQIQWTWPRLPYHYHGSGCTLASAIAARLAVGRGLTEAVAEAQAYTWETLARARRTGRCQLTPNRLFPLDDRS